jgi:DNA polymerase III delta prime subunit
MAIPITDISWGSILTPHRLDKTGIRRGLLEDLALKILYLHGEMSLIQLGESMRLSLGVISEIFESFRRERFCEVKGMTGGTHRIVASEEGRQRAASLLSLNQYAGPAPVSLKDYSARVRMQSVQNVRIGVKDLQPAFQDLVVSPDLLLRVGTAVVSGTSMFLYGPPGTGKTSLAMRLPSVYSDSVWIPYAVEVEDQIITLFDPGVHQRTPGGEPEETDRRWVLCRRPCVITGGELSLETLDVQYNPVQRYSAAPAQMKANNGVLVLDDFGRQRARPQELLNRWMTALGMRVEFLTLPGGQKFEIPFDVMVVFATNIQPSELGDEAFLRRIPNKILVDYAKEDQFKEIFMREVSAASRKIHVDPKDLDFLVNHITNDLKKPLCHCYARDILNQLFWASNYLEANPEFNEDLARWACSNYFVTDNKDPTA